MDTAVATANLAAEAPPSPVNFSASAAAKVAELIAEEGKPITRTTP